jgi:hypothetical protein
MNVFLSYAHDDNLVPDKFDGRGWVSFFDDSLSIELGERGLTDVKLWRDKRDFDPMGLVEDVLADNVKKSDLFLAVLSPRYVVQRYTKYELDSFAAHAAAAGRNRTGEFILIVLKRPLSPDKYPEAIRGMGYVPFFEIDRETRDDRPFYDGFGKHISQRYWESIRKVGALIEQHLAKRTAPAPLAAVNEKTIDTDRKVTVFVSEPSNELVDLRWSLCKELESHGCRIVPADAEPSDAGPDDAAQTRQRLQAAIDEADFSIHLLGTTAGGDRARQNESLAKQQLDLAAARAAADTKFRRLIWLQERPQSSPPAPTEGLIADLEGGKLLLDTDELVRSGLEAFKDVVREELANRSRAADKPGN